MSEHDAFDAMLERDAREEQVRIDREHGQHLLDIYADRYKAADPFLDAINRAHRAKAEADEK